VEDNDFSESFYEIERSRENPEPKGITWTENATDVETLKGNSLPGQRVLLTSANDEKSDAENRRASFKHSLDIVWG
jgi:hypothetical protein